MTTADIPSWIAAITGVISVCFLFKKMWDNRQQWKVTVDLDLLDKAEIKFHISQWGQGKRIQIDLDGDYAVAIFEYKSCKKPLTKLVIFDPKVLYTDSGNWSLKAESNEPLIEKIRREKPLWCRIFYAIPTHAVPKKPVVWVKIEYKKNLKDCLLLPQHQHQSPT